jgi:carboxyl-terminal processing protease
MMKGLRLKTLLHVPALMLLLSSGTLRAETDMDAESPEKTPIPLAQIRTFAEVFTRIKLNYVEPISDQQLLEYAIEGMLSGLDPHSAYYKGDRFDDLNEGTTGAFSGLGMEVIMEDGFVKVVAPIDDTPAAEAGIRTGDLIIRMDGKTVTGLSLSEATKGMRGEPGTKITITILRESKPDPFEVELSRAVVRLNSVKQNRLSDSIGYLRVTQFQTATAENFRKELKKFRESDGFEGLILDLRNNPGGLLTSAISIADVFIDGGVIVSTKGRSVTNDQEYIATPSDFLNGKPLVVLINGGSASASEIVAGALQDHGRALVLGTDSFGKGSVQTVLNIDDKEAIKLTTARYYTPSGRSIQASGITPDVIVEYREFKDREKSFKRIKENDLPGRLDSGDDEKENFEKPTKKQQEAKQFLARDYQLNEAFNLLNGLILFNSKTKLPRIN